MGFTNRRVSVSACLFVMALQPAHGTLPGDFNTDGIVADDDLAAFVACAQGPEIATAGACAVMSLDGDDDLDLGDFAAFSRAWLTADCTIDASASSKEGTGPQYDAFSAIDGLRSTRWSSAFADNQWIQLDFGHLRPLTGLTLHWEAAFASAYSIQVTSAGAGWTTVYSTTSGDGGTDVITFPPLSTRFLRVFCAQRATIWGNSLWEIELHSPVRCQPDPRPIDEQVDEILSAMTLEEKTSFVHGETAMSLRAVPRLKVPALQLADGPLGIRWGTSTAFPAPIAMAATWDVALVKRFGEAIAQEFRNKGRQVWLGPGMNIIRVPQCGRNFEYYSEDPFLAARMAVAAITGAQAHGVVACAKHYACNNQEFERTTVNVQADERTLREIYLPAFEFAVREANVLAVMASYNRINGPYATASQPLLSDILKDEWGFQGFVVSDWGAVHDTEDTALAGLDLEMDGASPTGAYWGNGQLLAAVQGGAVAESAIDDKVRRILRALLFTGIMDAPWDSPDEEIIAHRALVREIAREGIVLLKNEGNLLPLDKNAAQTIAVLGPNHAEARIGGGGSSAVTPYYAVGPLAGLENVAGPQVQFVSALGVPASDDYVPAPASFLTPPGGAGNGLRGEYFSNRLLQGVPAIVRTDATVNFNWGSGSPHASIPANEFSVRWSGTLTVPTTGTWDLGMATDDGFRLWLDGALLIDDWQNHGLQAIRTTLQLVGGEPHELVIEYYEDAGEAAAVLICAQNTALDEAVTAATGADAALIFVGLTSARESEGFDRGSIDLTGSEQALIHAVRAVNPNTVVVIVAGSQVGFEGWVDDVPAVVQAWYGGQEAGNAIADVIFGEINPGGRLPMTFVRRWADHPAYGLYPGGVYSDGLDVGYRYFDHAATPPAFPFGHGLSYTTFEYSDLTIDTALLASNGVVSVSFTVENTGARAGSETAQVYVRDVATSVPRPVKELKGFAKVRLELGSAKSVTVELGPRAFAYYDVASSDWRIEPGTFEILVGSSSQNIRLSGSFVHP